MYAKQVLCLLSLTLLFSSTAAHIGNCLSENSYLWKVDTEPPVYLFGTIHVPYTKLWDYIPENVKVAFSSCDEVCLELVLSDESTRQELADCQELPGSITSVDDVISKDTVDRVERYLESLRMVFPTWFRTGSSLFGGGNSDELFNSITNGWKKKRPIWILILLASITEEQIQSRNVPLLDLFLNNVAQGMGKQVQAMEKPRDQCRPLNKLNNDHVELALRVLLDHLEVKLEKNALRSNQESDIYTYRCGNFAELVSTTSFLPLPAMENITETTPTLTANETKVLSSIQDHLWHHMVFRRNRRMANSIHRLLESKRNKTMFIALGAGHYLSEDNVIDRLLKKGHSVEHILYHSHIDGPALPSDTIQLGDPNTRLRTLHSLEDTPESHQPTLSPETHERIWSRFQGNERKRATVIHRPHLTDSFSTSEGEVPTVRDSPNSQSGSNSPEWSQEGIELFIYPDPEAQSGSLASCSTQLTTLILSLLVALSLCLCEF